MKFFFVLAVAVALSWWASSQPGDQLPQVGWWNADKLVHASIWAGFAALIVAGGRARGWSARAAVLAAIGVGLLYGIVDEWHQSHVPNRDSSIADIVADVVGATLGALLVYRLARWPSSGPTAAPHRRSPPTSSSPTTPP